MNKIRSQKEEWTSKSEKESQSEFETIESGTIASEERPLCDLEPNKEQQKNTVSEAKGRQYMPTSKFVMWEQRGLYGGDYYSECNKTV